MQHQPTDSLSLEKPGNSEAPYLAMEYRTGRVHWTHYVATQPRLGAPTLILVHGAGHNEKVWLFGPDNWVEFFTRRGHNVITPSLTGHRPSVGVVALQPLQQYVRDAHKPAEVLGLDDARTFYIGHSMGGIVAQMLLEQYPAVAGVIVVDCIAPHRAFAQYAPFLKRLAHQHPLIFLRTLINPAAMFSSDELVRELLVGDALNDEQVRELRKTLGGETSVAMFEMLRRQRRGLQHLPGQKLLFIGAEESAFFSPAECLASASEQPGARHVSVPGTHNLMNTDSATLGAEAIEAFVARRSTTLAEQAIGGGLC